jgi:hypothetical protein
MRSRNMRSILDRICNGEPRTMEYDGLVNPLVVKGRSFGVTAIRPEQEHVGF